jgi:Fuc2NAc and GlcNAc transferase
MSSGFASWGVLGLAALASAATLTWVVRAAAMAGGLLDRPNSRSSHVQATPRAGGLAIVISVSVALVYLGFRHEVSPQLVCAVLIGGLAVAAVGLIDDWRSLAPVLRLLVHVAAAIWAVHCIRQQAGVQAGGYPLDWHGVVAVIGVVWMINLFNFMDGIDGIAAMEASTVALCGAVLAAVGGNFDPVLIAWVFACACAGFLFWNWPPARIFLGDVGSGYLGYVIAVLALGDTQRRPEALWSWLILCGVFVVDATLTLLVRMLRGARVWEPHRQHAYQCLARGWNSHLAVTRAAFCINLLWLFPLALLATLRPAWAAAAATCALLPLVFAAFLAGAGRSEVVAPRLLSDSTDRR